MISEGEHDAKAVGHEFGYTNNGGEQVGVEIQITSGEFKGSSITWYGGFSDEPAGDHTRTEWTMLDLKKLGWDGKNLVTLDGLGSRPVRIVVAHDTYNGKTSAKIKRIFANGGVAMKNKMDSAQLKALAAKIAGKAVLGNDEPPF